MEDESQVAVLEKPHARKGESIVKWNHPNREAMIDFIDAIQASGPLLDCPVRHRFTKGLYIREITCPAGAHIVTKILKQQHPFTLSEGRVSIYTEDKGVVKIEAPFTGITEPGTQRAIFCHTRVVWTTYHPNPDNITDLDLIEAMQVAAHDEVIDVENSRIEVADFTTGDVALLKSQ
jgi:hypothetical protein